jgi:hypothetical protein
MVDGGFRTSRSPVALACLGGLLEGEGSFLCSTATRASPAVALAMTDEDVVWRAGDLMEATTFALGARGENHKAVYSCRLRGGNAVSLMHALAPSLGARRNLQISQSLLDWQPKRHRRWLATEIVSIVQLRDVRMSPGDIGKRYGTDPKRITDLLSAACRGQSGMEAVTISGAASETDRWAAAGAGHDSNLAWLAGLPALSFHGCRVSSGAPK